jgi:ribonuclease HII
VAIGSRKYLSNPKIKVRAEHKADYNYPLVSAASIIAKEVREKKYKIKEEIGEIAQDTLQILTKKIFRRKFKHLKAQSHIRQSWATIKNLRKKKTKKSYFNLCINP